MSPGKGLNGKLHIHIPVRTEGHFSKARLLTGVFREVGGDRRTQRKPAGYRYGQGDRAQSSTQALDQTEDSGALRGTYYLVEMNEDVSIGI